MRVRLNADFIEQERRADSESLGVEYPPDAVAAAASLSDARGGGPGSGAYLSVCALNTRAAAAASEDNVCPPCGGPIRLRCSALRTCIPNNQAMRAVRTVAFDSVTDAFVRGGGCSAGSRGRRRVRSGAGCSHRSVMKCVALLRAPGHVSLWYTITRQYTYRVRPVSAAVGRRRCAGTCATVSTKAAGSRECSWLVLSGAAAAVLEPPSGSATGPGPAGGLQVTMGDCVVAVGDAGASGFP
jgi:hypothetical protein